MKDYKVLIIGPRHSGKTVFLSSMYYSLSIPTETKFFIDAVEHKNGKLLSERYMELGGQKKWPEANDNRILEYAFKCLLKTKHKNLEAFRITYYDYSGGRINDANIDDENEYKELLDSSDIHLGLLDGEILLRSLRDKEYTSEFYLKELDRLIIDLGLVHRQNKVVHFLVSKWDLLRYHNYSIADIKAHLISYERFKFFAENIIEDGGKIRLIPVSAVGFDFLEINENVIASKTNGVLKPYNVEMPLALALLDPMEVALKELQEKTQKAEEEARKTVHVDPNLTWWQKVQRSFGQLADTICNQFNIDNNFLHQISQWKSIGEDKVEEARLEEEKIRTNLKEELENVKDEQSAAAYVHQVFLANAYKLQQDHPGSLIDKI